MHRPIDADGNEARAGYEGWRVAGAGGIGVFFAALVVVTFPVLLKPWAEEFSWSREAVSAAFAIAALVAAVCAVPLGWVLDRVGPRRIVVPGLVVLGGTFASLSLLTPDLRHLYAVFALLGMAGISTSPVAYGRAIATWFRSKRGMALAVVITGGALGGILHPPVTQALIRHFGWRGACVALGVGVVALGVPVALRFVRERPGARAAEAQGPGATVRTALGTRLFWVLAFAQFGGIMVQNSVIVHLSALLTDRGLPPERGALAVSAMAVAAVLGRVVTGIFIDRVFAARVLVVLLAMAAAGALLLAGTPSFAVAVAAAMLVGFGTGGEADILPYLLSRYFGIRSFTALYGIAWMIGAMGGALGPIRMGRAFDAAGTYAPTLERMALLVLAAAATLLLLPRYGAGARTGEA